MANKHTPGPWKLFDRVHTHWPRDDVMTEAEPHRRICNVYGDTDDPINRANANLIAAAPDMLAALRQARDVLIAELGDSRYRVNFACIEAAIEKASGDERPHVLIRVTELEGV